MGEKYLTQAIGTRLLAHCKEVKAQTISRERVDFCVEEYVSASTLTDELKSRLFGYGRRLAVSLNRVGLTIFDLLSDVSRAWRDLDEVSCDLAYRAGIVQK